VRSYYHSFKLPVVIVRCNNVYGPNQYPEKLIPKFIKLLKQGKKLTIHGKGDTRRNFIWAEDVARATEVIFYKGELNEVYNIGTTQEYSVMDVATLLIEKMTDYKDINNHIEFVEDRPFNDFRYSVNSELLKTLGWSEIYTDFDKKEPVTTDMQYDLASVTKISATTVSIMKLYEEGKLDLDKTLGDYLPWTKGTNKAVIPVKEILLHQAGLIPFITFYKEIIDTVTGNPLPAYFSKTPVTGFTTRVAEHLYLRNDWQDSLGRLCKLQRNWLPLCLLDSRGSRIHGPTLLKTVDQKRHLGYNSYIQLKNGAENDKKTLYCNGKRD
jgi:hypothetical protein